MKDRRHALNILSCYQYDIAVIGEEAPTPINFKLFFKGADMGEKRSCRKGETNFDTIIDFLTGCC
jgi:hypothetical protein